MFLLGKINFPLSTKPCRKVPKHPIQSCHFIRLEKSNFPSLTAVDAGVVLSRHILAGHQNSGGGLPVSEKKKCPHSSARGRPRPGPARAKWEGPPLHPPDGNRSFLGGRRFFFFARADGSRKRTATVGPIDGRKGGGGGKAGLVRGAIPSLLLRFRLFFLSSLRIRTGTARRLTAHGRRRARAKRD